MGETTPSSANIRLVDLGFSRPWTVVATCVSTLATALVVWLQGGTMLMMLAGAATSFLVMFTSATAAGRHLRRTMIEPLGELARALEQLRTTGHAPKLDESAAPVLQPMMRRFNLASVAMEQRSQMSQANLLSVEAAFDRVHAVLQSLRESVVVVDPNGRVVLANRSARGLLLPGQEHIEGRTLLDLLDGELRSAFSDGVMRIDAKKASEVHAADLVYQGRIIDLAIVQVQSNRPDQDFGKVVVFVDVTRNHELNRLKDELLSSISHELRTPLTNMCSSSEILTNLTAGDHGEWREFAQMLNAESRRLKVLVDDVMEYSLLETRRASWTLEQADIGTVVEHAVELIRAKASQKSLRVTCEVKARTTAMVDRQQLTSAMCRLLDNAVKFTPTGGKVHVETSEHDGLVDVSIADSGIGIPAADRQRVFERFCQIGDVMTGKPQGTGLGLSITQRIIDGLGGTLWCEDSPLGGVRFRFVLPATGSVPGGVGVGAA